jgi:hypothetical protein
LLYKTRCCRQQRGFALKKAGDLNSKGLSSSGGGIEALNIGGVSKGRQCLTTGSIPGPQPDGACRPQFESWKSHGHRSLEASPVWAKKLQDRVVTWAVVAG